MYVAVDGAVFVCIVVDCVAIVAVDVVFVVFVALMSVELSTYSRKGMGLTHSVYETKGLAPTNG